MIDLQDLSGAFALQASANSRSGDGPRRVRVLVSGTGVPIALEDELGMPTKAGAAAAAPWPREG
jgi:hypothetical protein